MRPCCLHGVLPPPACILFPLLAETASRGVYMQIKLPCFDARFSTASKTQAGVGCFKNSSNCASMTFQSKMRGVTPRCRSDVLPIGI